MEYVIDAKPEMKDIDKKSFLKIKDKIENNIEITNDEKSLFLDYYIKVAREILADYLNVDILLDPLVNRCDLAQNIIGKLLESVNNVIVFPKETQQVIYPTCLGHSFLICIIQNNSYLVDLTYRQFFLQKNCSVDNFMTKEKKALMTPDPGYFVMQDDKAKEIASRIICDGYIELNDETAKKYGDSFYYTKTGDEQLSDIPAYIYLKTMLKENHAYAIDEERFSEMYGKVK